MTLTDVAAIIGGVVLPLWALIIGLIWRLHTNGQHHLEVRLQMLQERLDAFEGRVTDRVNELAETVSALTERLGHVRRSP